MHQQLEQIHISSDSVQHQLVMPAALPVPFAVSTLMQPGPLFLGDLSDTGLDSSTVLPQTRQSACHSKQGWSGILPLQQNGVAELWQSTAWGQGTAPRFSSDQELRMADKFVCSYWDRGQSACCADPLPY